MDASWTFDIPQLKNSLFSSVPHFLIELLDSLESNFLISLNVLDISPLSDVGLVKIFPQSIGCCFPLLTVFYAFQKLCNFMRSHLLILFFIRYFLHLHFQCYPKSSPYPPLHSPTHPLPLLGSGISLMTKDVEHFFGCFLTISIPQLRILCLALYPMFLVGLFVSLESNFLVLCIYWILALYQM